MHMYNLYIAIGKALLLLRFLTFSGICQFNVLRWTYLTRRASPAAACYTGCGEARREIPLPLGIPFDP